MKSTSGIGMWRGVAMAALLVPLAFAQTRYTVTVLTVPPPYLGGNVSAIENGVAGGWVYTNCNNQPGCTPQEVAMLWPNLQAAGADLTGIAQLTPTANITGVQPTLLAGWDTASGTAHAVVVSPLSSGHIDLNGIFFGSKVLASCGGYQAGYAQISPITSSGGGSQGVTWHAMTWTGDVNTWSDLHNFHGFSQALGRR